MSECWRLASTALIFSVVSLSTPVSSPAGSRSLQQLAFAQLLSRRLPGLLTQPAAFDPVFMQSDKHLLTACGFQVCQAAMLCQSGSSSAPASMQPAFSLLCMQVIDAQVCHQSADGPTLFFMPHCERQVFEDLLAANWAPDKLPKVAILGETLGSKLRPPLSTLSVEGA